MNTGKNSESRIMRQRAEELLMKKTSGTDSRFNEVETRKLIHELEVHQIELELQNEELILAESAAQVASEKYLDLYNELYDFAPSGYFTLSKEGKIIALNLSGANMLGKERYLLKNNLFGLFVTTGTIQVFKHFISNIFNSEAKQTCEVTLLSKDNAKMYVHLTSIASPDREQCIVNVVDITERKLAEDLVIKQREELKKRNEELEKSEEKFRLLTENASDLIWTLNLTKGKYTYVGPSVIRLSGYTAEEAMQHSIEESLTPESVKKVYELIPIRIKEFTKNPESGKIYLDQFGQNCKDGTVKWIEATTKLQYNAVGEIEVTGVSRDITDRKRAEEALKVTQTKLELALSIGNVGMWERDLKTKRLFWDNRMERMFGLEAGTFEGTYEAFEKYIVEEDVSHTREAIRRAIEENASFETIYRIRLANGEVKYINGKGSVKQDESGKAVKLSGVCFDITEMKQGAEKALFKLNDELLRSNKELEQFAYIASHDLQEPLRMVSSFTQLLAQRYKDKLDKDARKFIYYAREGALRSQGLINDLLDYSRIGTKDQIFTAVDFNKVLAIAVDNLITTIQEKNAVVTCCDLPTVIGDEGQLVQLMQNLIGNALKFCYAEPRVHISAKEESDHYLFSVRDNGIGIEEKYFDRIFLIFQRLVPKDEYGGTGIGLAICKRIVERNGGKIWIESHIGEGTTFYFTIAIAKEQSL